MSRLARGCVVAFAGLPATVESTVLLPAARLQVDLDNGARVTGQLVTVRRLLPVIEAAAA